MIERRRRRRRRGGSKPGGFWHICDLRGVEGLWLVGGEREFKGGWLKVVGGDLHGDLRNRKGVVTGGDSWLAARPFVAPECPPPPFTSSGRSAHLPFRRRGWRK